MASFLIILPILATFLSSLSNTTAYLYNGSSQGLTQIPHDDISDNITILFLKNNSIQSFDYLEPYDSLVNVTVSYNILDSFPNLVNVSAVLEVLNLEGNRITSIPAHLLDQLVNLGNLRMGANPLVTFPDVAGPAGKLNHIGLGYTFLEELPDFVNLGVGIISIYLHGTRITGELTKEKLDWLPKLGLLLVSDTDIKTFPDFCRIGHSMSIGMEKLVLDPGNRALMLKFAIATGHLTVKTNGTTKTTINGNMLDVITTDIEDVSHLGNSKAFFKDLTNQAEFYCYPRVLPSLSNVNPGACAYRCLKTPGCAMFARDAGACVLTALEPGSSGDFNAYNQWMMLQ